MSDLKFSNDLLANILFRLDEPTDSSSDFYDQALICMNRAYMALCAGGIELEDEVDEEWWWLKDGDMPAVLTLMPAVELTASLTNNSAAVTLGSTPSRNLLGCVVRVTNELDVYRVLAHSGTSTSLTLDGVFTGTTNATAGLIFEQRIYDIPSTVLKITGPMTVTRESVQRVVGISAEDMELQYPTALRFSGIPLHFAMATQTKVRFSHVPVSMTRVDFPYLVRPTMLTDSVSEEPLVPLEFRRLLTDYGAMFLAQDKEDSREETFAAMARSGLRSMVKEQRRRMGRHARPNFGRIYTRPLNGDTRGPVRTSSGLIIG